MRSYLVKDNHINSVISEILRYRHKMRYPNKNPINLLYGFAKKNKVTRTYMVFLGEWNSYCKILLRFLKFDTYAEVQVHQKCSVVK